MLIFPHCPSVFRKNLQKSLFKQVWGTRLVCAAKLSGVREFPKAGLKVITGCTKHPAFNSKYCQEHCTEESPAVTASSVSSRTRQQLRKYRTDTASYAEAEQDEVYIVESIMEIKSKEVLVKWVGFPNPTWENENGIPKFIRNYYEKNPAKLGKVLPNPKIKHSKTIGETVIHKLSWGDEPGAEWISEDFFKLLDDNGEITESTESTSCNTRKSRDKRQNVHSVGVFTGAYPCGVIVLGDELYGSESISQVYGILTDWLNSLSDKTKLKQILYDDMCHLKRFCENPERAGQNEVTEVLAGVQKHVDKFHFRETLTKK